MPHQRVPANGGAEEKGGPAAEAAKAAAAAAPVEIDDEAPEGLSGVEAAEPAAVPAAHAHAAHGHKRQPKGNGGIDDRATRIGKDELVSAPGDYAPVE